MNVRFLVRNRPKIGENGKLYHELCNSIGIFGQTGLKWYLGIIFDMIIGLIIILTRKRDSGVWCPDIDC